MPDVRVTVPVYSPSTGVVLGYGTDGWATADVVGGAVELRGDAAGLRHLAAWCLALASSGVPDGSHVHLDPGVEMMSVESRELLLVLDQRSDPGS
ncbi:hypothetical protein [Kineosporia sp. A_224]|uniref:Imm32 family immunity protein n=1 Tax=Kineosporia sp. A_224 TaxID=1962180 RepID=UPI000B4B23D2|nr:hypothetical protein [Kineosporia sp. A_224]